MLNKYNPSSPTGLLFSRLTEEVKPHGKQNHVYNGRCGITIMAALIEDEPAEDTEYAREHVDSKALAEERERKEALGIHMG